MLTTLSQFMGQYNNIGVNRGLLRMCGGDYEVAVVLGECIYWTGKSTHLKDNWFHRSYPEWQKALELTRYKVERAINKTNILAYRAMQQIPDTVKDSEITVPEDQCVIQKKVMRVNRSNKSCYKVDENLFTCWFDAFAADGEVRKSRMAIVFPQTTDETVTCEKLTDGDDSDVHLRETDRCHLRETDRSSIYTDSNNNSNIIVHPSDEERTTPTVEELETALDSTSGADNAAGVVNIQDLPDGWQSNDRYVYIGRQNGNLPQSPWANPFKDGTREEMIEKYRNWLLKQPDLLRSLPALKDKTLVCCCALESCHGDVLLGMLGQKVSPEPRKGKRWFRVWHDEKDLAIPAPETPPEGTFIGYMGKTSRSSKYASTGRTVWVEMDNYFLLVYMGYKWRWSMAYQDKLNIFDAASKAWRNKTGEVKKKNQLAQYTPQEIIAVFRDSGAAAGRIDLKGSGAWLTKLAEQKQRRQKPAVHQPPVDYDATLRASRPVRMPTNVDALEYGRHIAAARERNANQELLAGV